VSRGPLAILSGGWTTLFAVAAAAGAVTLAMAVVYAIVVVALTFGGTHARQ
jgi:hypothetical protein